MASTKLTGSRFPVFGKLNRAGAPIKGTVIINRKLGLFAVRPYRSRDDYTLPLSEVATIVCQRIALAQFALSKK